MWNAGLTIEHIHNGEFIKTVSLSVTHTHTHTEMKGLKRGGGGEAQSAMAVRVPGSAMATRSSRSTMAVRIPGSAMATRGSRSAMATRGSRSAMATRGSRSAMATRGSRSAMRHLRLPIRHAPPEAPDPPWPPEAPDPPWQPEAPDPPWRLPQCPCPASASRAPTLPPRCFCYGAGRAIREGEVMLRIHLSVLHHTHHHYHHTPAPVITWASIKHTCTSSDPHHLTLLKHTPLLSRSSDLINRTLDSSSWSSSIFLLYYY